VTKVIEVTEKLADDQWRYDHNAEILDRLERIEAKIDADLAAEKKRVARLLAVTDLLRRHTHQGIWAMTAYAGPDPEHDCGLCRALVAADILTLDDIGSGTRAAILAETADTAVADGGAA